MIGLIGTNGAGVDAVRNDLGGLLAPWQGQITFAGQPLGEFAPGGSRRPRHRARSGRTAAVRRPHRRAEPPTWRLPPERPRPDWPRPRPGWPAVSVLRQRLRQYAGASGGEQQMCAIGRALMARPRSLLIVAIARTGSRRRRVPSGPPCGRSTAGARASYWSSKTSSWPWKVPAMATSWRPAGCQLACPSSESARRPADCRRVSRRVERGLRGSCANLAVGAGATESFGGG